MTASVSLQFLYVFIAAQAHSDGVFLSCGRSFTKETWGYYVSSVLVRKKFDESNRAQEDCGLGNQSFAAPDDAKVTSLVMQWEWNLKQPLDPKFPGTGRVVENQDLALQDLLNSQCSDFGKVKSGRFFWWISAFFDEF